MQGLPLSSLSRWDPADLVVRNSLDTIHTAVSLPLQDEVITTPGVILKNKFVLYGRADLENFRNSHFEACCDDDTDGDVCLNSGKKIMESFL